MSAALLSSVLVKWAVCLPRTVIFPGCSWKAFPVSSGACEVPTTSQSDRQLLLPQGVRTFFMFPLDLAQPKLPLPLFYVWLCRVLLMKKTARKPVGLEDSRADSPVLGWHGLGDPLTTSTLLSLGWTYAVFRRPVARCFGLPWFRLSLGSRKNVTMKNGTIRFLRTSVHGSDEEI